MYIKIVTFKNDNKLDHTYNRNNIILLYGNRTFK